LAADWPSISGEQLCAAKDIRSLFYYDAFCHYNNTALTLHEVAVV